MRAGERFGIRQDTLYRRAWQEGWTRAKVWRARAATLVARPAPTPADGAPVDVVSIVDNALTQAANLLANGQPKEAAEIVKAANAVGELCDLAERLRQEVGGRMLTPG